MAGFFDTLFGGGAEREAADKNRALYSQYGQLGTGYLDTGLTQSLGALNSAYGNANTTLGQNRDIYGNLLTAGNAAIDKGQTNFDPLAALGQKYGQGSSLYLDSLGANGAAGNAKAQSAFQAGPGYQFTLDQGLDALNRRRAAGGMLNSGNADIDALKFGTGLANQTYGDWQSKLAGLISPELSATSGAAQGRAGLDTARLNLLGNVASGQAGTNAAIAGNYVNQGNSLGNLYSTDATNRVGLQGNVTSGDAQANQLQAQGEAGGAKNLLGGLLGGASILAGGGMGGLGALGSGMGGAFMGGGSPTGYGTGGLFSWLKK